MNLSIRVGLLPISTFYLGVFKISDYLKCVPINTHTPTHSQLNALTLKHSYTHTHTYRHAHKLTHILTCTQSHTHTCSVP